MFRVATIALRLLALEVSSRSSKAFVLLLLPIRLSFCGEMQVAMFMLTVLMIVAVMVAVLIKVFRRIMIVMQLMMIAWLMMAMILMSNDCVMMMAVW